MRTDPMPPETGRADLDDRQLAEAFTRLGAEWAFRELYRRHTPRLFRLLVRLAPAGADTDAMVQETWLRASRALPRFRWQSALSTWLTGIAVNVMREHTRVDFRRPAPLPLEEVSDTAITVAPRAGTDVDLERAVAALPPGYRAVLLLHDVEGCTHQEIAECLGIAAGTSKSQLANARRVLRTHLGQSTGDGR